jgi:RNA polymerase sigma factor (sigma-70 family)
VLGAGDFALMAGRLDLEALFLAEAPRLRRFLRRFGPSVSAEDVTQDAFARLCQVEAEAVASPRALLFRTARNLAIDQVRRRNASPVRTAPDLDAFEARLAAPSAEDAVVANERIAAVQAALAALDDNERAALLWRRRDGLSPGEIGRRLGMGARNAQRLIARALARCQAHVRAAEGAGEAGLGVGLGDGLAADDAEPGADLCADADEKPRAGARDKNGRAV